MVWILFIALSVVIGWAGYLLSQTADEIAEKTGLGRNWVGLIFLATITSLPELMTGISSIQFTGNPDLAVGDILGSCVFNLSLVFILDLSYREGSVYSRATRGHILSGAMGMILISFVGFALVVSKRFLGFGYGHIGGYAAFIPVFYALSMRTLYSFEQQSLETQKKVRVRKLHGLYLSFAWKAAIVVTAGCFLPFVGEEIIRVMGWNSAFVGTLFIAFATSLPEIAVTLSALRLKAVELAFSNLLGSNLFNIVILAIDDFFYTDGFIFQAVTPTHTVTVFSAVMMTGLVMSALIQPPQKKFFNTASILSILLLVIYIVNAYIVFKMGA